VGRIEQPEVFIDALTVVLHYTLNSFRIQNCTHLLGDRTAITIGKRSYPSIAH